MFGLPKPSTFIEGQRQFFGLMASGAGMACGLGAIAMVCLLYFGHWSKAEEHTIVVTFGLTLGGCILCMSGVIFGLLVGGPVGRFKTSADKSGVSFEIDGDDAAKALAAAAVARTMVKEPEDDGSSGSGAGNSPFSA